MIQLYVRDASGKRVDVSFQELVDKTMDTKLSRADLHISRTRDGDLLLTSRQDGMIRMLVPDRGREWVGEAVTLGSSVEGVRIANIRFERSLLISCPSHDLI
jgi:hypothetical protein